MKSASTVFGKTRFRMCRVRSGPPGERRLKQSTHGYALWVKYSTQVPSLPLTFREAAITTGLTLESTRFSTIPVYFALRDVFARGKKVEELIKMIANDRLYPHPAALVTILGDHDVPRFLSEKAATADRLRLALTFLMTARGTPVIYYGDEIGMQGGEDPDNRRDFPGGWPGDAPNAFSSSGRIVQQASIYNCTRKLARLRQQLSPLRRGEMLNLAESKDAWVYARQDSSGTVLVAINGGDQDTDHTVSLAGNGDTFGRRLKWVGNCGLLQRCGHHPSSVSNSQGLCTRIALKSRRWVRDKGEK